MSEEEILASPVDKISSPKKINDQIVPFSMDEVEALERTAKKSRHPAPDYAIIVLMLERVSMNMRSFHLPFGAIGTRGASLGRARLEARQKSPLRWMKMRQRGLLPIVQLVICAAEQSQDKILCG